MFDRYNSLFDVLKVEPLPSPKLNFTPFYEKRLPTAIQSIVLPLTYRAQLGLTTKFVERLFMTEPNFGPQFDQINFGTADFIHATYNPDSPIEERFISWWGRFAHYANHHPFDLMYMEQMANSHLYPLFGEQESTRFYGETRRIIKDGQEQGLIKDLEPSFINQFVRNALMNVIKVNIIVGKGLTDEQVETLVRCCWDGIRK